MFRIALLIILVMNVVIAASTKCQVDGWRNRCVPKCDPNVRVHCKLDMDDSCAPVRQTVWRKRKAWERTWTREAARWIWRWRRRVKWEPRAVTKEAPMASVPPSARRTFDTAAATRRAAKRDVVEEDERPLEPLRAHNATHIPNFERLVGRTQVVGARGGGFYCRECDSLHKDSNQYLAHINSRAHLKKIGMGTRARRATLDEVLQAFEVERRRARGEDEPPPMEKLTNDEVELDPEQRLRAEMGLPTDFGSTK